MNQKGRLWATVGYPESLPNNWIEQLQETGLQIAISPLHNKDVNPDGSTKKEHYHIILVYDGPTTYKHVKDFCNRLNMVNPIKLESLRGMYRYHIHIDNPEKYQYNDGDRILLNGFEKENGKYTESEIEEYCFVIINFIEDNYITEYRDLIDNLKKSDSKDLCKIAMRKTILLNSYIKSKRHKEKEEKERIKLTMKD